MFKRYYLLLGAFIVVSLFGVTYSYPQNQQDSQLTIIEGEITDIFLPFAMLETSDGEECELFLGPPWFLMDTDIFLRIGDKIKAKGELEEYKNIRTFYPYTIFLGKEKIEFIDEEGIPIWAYRSNRGMTRDRYNNGNIPNYYRRGRGYYRYYGRNQLYGRGMSWGNCWGQRGKRSWMNGRRWNQRYSGKWQGRGFYYSRRRFPNRYWNFYKEY